MKKVLSAAIVFMILIALPVTAVQANSLDDVITEQSQGAQGQVENNTGNTNQTTQNSSTSSTNDSIIQDLKSASDLANVDTHGADSVNNGIRTVAAFIVKILSYFITAFLVVRVLLDLTYITLPFTRTILSNGYAGNPQAGGGAMGMQGGMGGMGSPMGGMGMGGMGMGGMGGMGMRGGYGMGRMGMGGMGMGGMGMPGTNAMGGQMGASPAMGRVQWVSDAALNAVAAETQPGYDGQPHSALKTYAKNMTTILVITPILLTLAITGVLSSLGFLLGDVIAKGISSIGGMI